MTMTQAAEPETGHLGDLRPDPKQKRRRTLKNLGLIEQALGEVGAARSIVVDEDNVVLAGNGTVEAAAAAGITRVKYVEADGNEIVAVRRRGLSRKQKTRLAIYDNRAAELAQWNVEALLAETDVLDGIIAPGELDLIVDRDQDRDRSGDSDKDKPEPKPEFDLSPQPHERYNYVVLIFRNEMDFTRASEYFGLQRVQDPTSPAIGVGRVIDGAAYLRRVGAVTKE